MATVLVCLSWDFQVSRTLVAPGSSCACASAAWLSAVPRSSTHGKALPLPLGTTLPSLPDSSCACCLSQWGSVGYSAARLLGRHCRWSPQWWGRQVAWEAAQGAAGRIQTFTYIYVHKHGCALYLYCKAWKGFWKVWFDWAGFQRLQESSILNCWHVNIDIQPCGVAIVIAHYIAKYVAKCESTSLEGSLRHYCSNQRGGKQYFSTVV